MKKIFTAWLAACCMMSFCACQSADTRQVSEETSVTEEQTQAEATAGKLQNKMSEQERNRVSVGRLSLLRETEASTTNDEPVVEIEWMDYDALYTFFTEQKETEVLSEEEYQEILQSLQPDTVIANNIKVDGRYYLGFAPPYQYKGGEVSGTAVTTEGDYIQQDSGDVSNIAGTDMEEVTFSCADFAEFSNWYRDYCDQRVISGTMSQEEADQEYTDMLTVWKSVMDGTDQSPQSENFKNNWEFDADEMLKIRDSVSEISIYDEELDTTFLVHVTLPPDFDASQTYPMFVMTDGVWRFGDHPALWNMMKNEEAEDVILVSIGYDFELDGTDNAVRAVYFCEKKDLFLDFITDNLMPYLSEWYSIDFSQSGLYGHSLGGVFTHYAVCNSDLFENQPFQYYIIGSPAFWSPYFLPNEDNPPAYQSEYGYFDRNDTLNKTLYVCGGEQEDADYEEYYGENDSTIEGISHFMQRLEEHSVTTAECKIYDVSNHYEYIPDMFREFFLKFYGKS